MRPHRSVLLLLTWLPALHSPAAAALEHYEGQAYRLKGGQLLYRESHWLQADGERLVLYRCPTGEPFARKVVSDGTPAPDFELVDARDGYREGVRTRDGQREVFTQANGKAGEQRKPLPSRSQQIIDAGFDAYIRQQWNTLTPSDTRQVAFVLPSRLDTLAFKLQPRDSRDPAARSFRLSLDAWYGAAIPGITVTYAQAGRRLLRFEGIGNIRDDQGDYPSVRIEFPPAQRRSATPGEIDAARRQPLVNRCQRR